MKKFIKYFIMLFVFTFSLAACGGNNTSSSDQVNTTSSSSVKTVEKYTVQFYVEDELYKTMKVEENTVIGSSNVTNPTKEGLLFVAWVDENDNEVNLDTYVVVSNLKLYATFEELITDDTLIVDAKKEAGVDYYLVVGWWEVIGTNEDGTPKITSSLTKDTVRIFYANLNLYLEAYGATEDQMKLVQFRDYSTELVADMGAKINEDGDVDLVIGVGNNINSNAGVELFEGNEGKTTAMMGTAPKSRYVALPNHEEMNPLAISIFDWIKTDVGQTAFTTPLTANDIVVVPERTDEVDVTITVHGVTGDPVVTHLTNKNDPIAVPEITLEANHKFLGYALTSDAEEAVISIGLGVALTYDDIEDLLNGASSLVLYPVIIEEIIDTTYDLVVYVHAVSTASIKEIDVELLKYRFSQTLEEPMNINYVVITEGAAADFLNRINEDIANGETIDVVIGGNATTKNLTAIDETYINTSCALGHFDSDNRKVIVLNSCASTHVELAKSFYTFMTTEPDSLDLTFAYWVKNYEWISEEELNAITEGITAYINELFAVEDAYTTYKLTIDFYTCTNSKVADLSAETKALHDGKGVGMIIGTGGNATDDDKMGSDIIEQKDVPTSMIANSRKVAICNDNFIYQSIYYNYFVETVVEDTVTE